jgi:hypothetical protein
MFVLTVPLLVLVLCVRTGFLLGDIEPDLVFSLITDWCLDRLPNCSRPKADTDILAGGVQPP